MSEKLLRHDVKYIEKPCEQRGIVTQLQAKKSYRRFCTRACANKHNSIRFSGSGNPAFGKVYRTKETHPE